MELLMKCYFNMNISKWKMASYLCKTLLWKRSWNYKYDENDDLSLDNFCIGIKAIIKQVTPKGSCHNKHANFSRSAVQLLLLYMIYIKWQQKIITVNTVSHQRKPVKHIENRQQKQNLKTTNLQKRKLNTKL